MVNANPKSNSKLEPELSTDRRLNTQSWILIGLGLLLLFGGLIIYTFVTSGSDLRNITAFVICVGLAITLSEIGTRADIRYRGAVITGAGAIALLFYIILTPTTLCRFGIHCAPPPPSITTYEITGYAKLPGNTSSLDNDLLRITTFPRSLDVEPEDAETLKWTETLVVELDSNGRPTPKDLIVTFPGYLPANQPLPLFSDVDRSGGKATYEFKEPFKLSLDPLKPK
jgi:hypothetical protein